MRHAFYLMMMIAVSFVAAPVSAQSDDCWYLTAALTDEVHGNHEENNDCMNSPDNLNGIAGNCIVLDSSGNPRRNVDCEGPTAGQPGHCRVISQMACGTVDFTVAGDDSDPVPLCWADRFNSGCDTGDTAHPGTGESWWCGAGGRMYHEICVWSDSLNQLVCTK